MSKLITTLNRLKSADSPIKSLTCDIDAGGAASVLEIFNTNNRPVSKSKTALYANEMLRNKWALNGEPLIFGIDEEGNEAVISGQHRLLALIKAQDLYNADPDKYPDVVSPLTLHTVVIYGVDLTTADTVDQINPRSHGDVLFRDEWTNTQIPEEFKKSASKRAYWCKVLGGAARLVWLRAGGATVSSAPKFLTSEMLDFIKIEHPQLCKFVSEVLSAADGKENSGLRMSLPYVAALSYVAALDVDKNDEVVVDEAKHEKVSLFLSQVASGTGYATGSPAHAITQYWNKLTAEAGSKDRDLEWVAPFVKCLTALINGAPCKPSDLKLSKKEADNYKNVPCLMPGWDTAMFEYAKSLEALSAEQKAAAIEQKEADKLAKTEAREQAKAEKAEAAEKAKAEKAKAKKDAEEAEKAKTPEAKPATTKKAPSVVGKFVKRPAPASSAS